jgi:hypothetical protein
MVPGRSWKLDDIVSAVKDALLAIAQTPGVSLLEAEMTIPFILIERPFHKGVPNIESQIAIVDGCFNSIDNTPLWQLRIVTKAEGKQLVRWDVKWAKYHFMNS